MSQKKHFKAVTSAAKGLTSRPLAVTEKWKLSLGKEQKIHEYEKVQSSSIENYSDTPNSAMIILLASKIPRQEIHQTRK